VSVGPPRSLREAWTGAPLPAVVVPDAVSVERARALRERFSSAGFRRFALLDRGSFDVLVDVPDAELLDVVAGVASAVSGRALAVGEARVLRLRPGDYVLLRNDRAHEDRPVEAVLDLSERAVARAEVHYRHRGQVYFAFGGPPGALALVERGPTVLANHTYVTKRQENDVVRLVVLLRDG